MKPLLLLSTILLTGCQNFRTSFTAAFEKDGQRFEGTVTVEPTGKNVVRRVSK